MRRGRQAQGPLALATSRAATTYNNWRAPGRSPLLLLLALGSDNFEMAALASLAPFPFQNPFSFPKPLTHSTFAPVSIRLFLQLFKVGPAIRGALGRQKTSAPRLPSFYIQGLTNSVNDTLRALPTCSSNHYFTLSTGLVSTFEAHSSFQCDVLKVEP